MGMIRFFILGFMFGGMIGFTIAALLNASEHNVVNDVRPILARMLRMIIYDIVKMYETEVNTDEDDAYNSGVKDCHIIVEQYLEDVEGDNNNEL